jgi:adenylate kinase
MKLHILYGPPGAGKTTLSENLPKSIAYISMGAIARKEIALESKLGRELQHYIEQVREYPSALVQQVINNALRRERSQVIVFDGFPKFQREIPILETLLTDIDSVPGNAVVLNLSLDEALARMASRRICPHCSRQFGQFHEMVCPTCKIGLVKRDDDTDASFTLRFNDYLENNHLILSRLHDLGFTIIRLSSKHVTADTFLASFA